MKKLLFIFWVILISNPGSAQSPSQDILKKIDSLVTYQDTDFSGEYTIVQERPNQGRSVTKAGVFRRDKEEKYLILIMEPVVDKGKGYLKIGNNLWLYDPVSRRFNVTSAKDRFQNSNARNSDFTRSNLAGDYRVVSESQEKLGIYQTRVLTLEATNDQVSFPKMKIWVDEENLVRKYEDYSLSGQHLRTTAIPNYQRVGNRFVPVSILIVDQLKGAQENGVFKNERTLITIAKPTLNRLPDLVFTQAYLEKVGR